MSFVSGTDLFLAIRVIDLLPSGLLAVKGSVGQQSIPSRLSFSSLHGWLCTLQRYSSITSFEAFSTCRLSAPRRSDIKGCLVNLTLPFLLLLLLCCYSRTLCTSLSNNPQSFLDAAIGQITNFFLVFTLLRSWNCGPVSWLVVSLDAAGRLIHSCYEGDCWCFCMPEDFGYCVWIPETPMSHQVDLCIANCLTGHKQPVLLWCIFRALSPLQTFPHLRTSTTPAIPLFWTIVLSSSSAASVYSCPVGLSSSSIHNLGGILQQMFP